MNIVRDFLRDRFGNFGIAMAILTVPLIGAMGAAIDYSRALNVREQLMGASDAAALGVIGPSSKAYQAALKMKENGKVKFDDKDVRSLFVANARQYVDLVDDDFTIEVNKAGDDLSSAVTFTVPVPTSFMKIFGYDALNVSGRATATFAAGTPSYMDVHLVLDNSPSMGLGATTNDINALIAATPSKCAFACHEVWNSGVENENSNYKVARAKGITLRIDVLRQSVVNLVDYAIGVQGSNTGAFRFAAYTMGKAALETGYQIDKLSGLTADLTSFRKVVNGVTLMSTPHSQYHQDALTSFETTLGSVNKEIKQDGGSGGSPTDRQQIVLFVTDGVGNSIKTSNCGGFYDGNQGRCFEPIDLNLCKALTDRKIKLAVLYTTYVPIKDHLYDTYVSKFVANIPSRLKQCASPDLFAEVNISGDMQAAIKNLFTKATVAKRRRISS